MSAAVAAAATTGSNALRAPARLLTGRRLLAPGLTGALVLIAASLVACDSPARPSVSPTAPTGSAEEGAWQAADLLAVVTGHEVNALVGINVATMPESERP